MIIQTLQITYCMFTPHEYPVGETKAEGAGMLQHLRPPTVWIDGD